MARRLQRQPACQDLWHGQERGCAQLGSPGRGASLRTSAATLEAAPTSVSEAGIFPLENKAGQKGPTVLIAGAGIGGLVLAVGLLKRGINVQIFERDVTAVRGEGKYRGPIQVHCLSPVPAAISPFSPSTMLLLTTSPVQVQSNALAALEALDTTVAEKVLAEGCITGDRVNGLCDGVTGHWQALCPTVSFCPPSLPKFYSQQPTTGM